jgi:hypothetical protein
MALVLYTVEGIRKARRAVLLLMELTALELAALELAALELAVSVSNALLSVRPLRLDILWTSIDGRGLLGVLCLARHSYTIPLLFSFPEAHSAFLLLFERVFCFVLDSASSLLTSSSFRDCTTVSVGWSKYSLADVSILGDPCCSFPPFLNPLNILWLISTGPFLILAIIDRSNDGSIEGLKDRLIVWWMTEFL